MALVSAAKFPRFSIYSTGPTSGQVVYMDGQRLPGVTDVQVHMAVGIAATVTVTFIAESVNADTAELTKLMKESDEGGAV